MAVVRIWRTRIDPQRADEYRDFANDISLPMFRSHAGLLGVVFGDAGAGRAVVTFWVDAEAAAALEASSLYRETVERIEQTGFILGPSSVDLYEIAGGLLDQIVP